MLLKSKNTFFLITFYFLEQNTKEIKEDIRMSKLNISNFHTVIACSAD